MNGRWRTGVLTGVLALTAAAIATTPLAGAGSADGRLSVKMAGKITIERPELVVPLGVSCTDTCGNTKVSARVVDKTTSTTRRYRLKDQVRDVSAGKPVTIRMRLRGTAERRRRVTGRLIRAIRRGDDVTAKVKVRSSSQTIKRSARLRAADSKRG